MKQKTLPAMQVLYFTTITTLAKLQDVVIQVPDDLYKEAIKLGLFISGPQYWIYYGADGNPNTEFTLDIVIPVNGTPKGESKYAIKTIDSFTYVSAIHNGEWKELGKTYEKAIGWVYGNQLSMLPGKECREMYLNIDLTNTNNNITEVMIGIV